MHLHFSQDNTGRIIVQFTAYKLQLPEGEQIHPVFHCSKLKPFCRSTENVEGTPLPAEVLNDQPLVFPLDILDSCRASNGDA